MMVAAGEPHITLRVGRTVSALGDAPKLHARVLPEVTSVAMGVGKVRVLLESL